jgi:hypothetical protein
MNCWFKRIEYTNFGDLSDKLNEISADAGVHDVCIIKSETILDEEVHNIALIKITGIKSLGYTVDGSGKCKVTT